MENPKIGDIVLHRSGYRAEIIGLGSIATDRGLAPLYNLKFLEGPFPGVNCLRQEFTFPPTGKA
jgi:hypothetical protein